MARRGERIGDAYIRIHADGSAISNEVREELDKADKPIGKSGERLGSEYMKGVRKGIKEDRGTTNREILTALEGSQGETEKRGRLIAGRLMKGIRDQLEKTEGRDVSRAMTRLLEQGIQEGTIKNKAALKDLLADEQRFAQLRASGLRELVRLEGEAHTEALKLNREFDIQRRRTIALAVSMGDLDERFHEFRIRSNRASDSIGRLFGRGARNDFINLVGATVRGIALMTARLVEFGLRTKVVFSEGARESGNFLGGFTALARVAGTKIAELGKLLVSPKGLAGFLVIAPLISHAVGALSSIFIGLGGALTGIGSAVVGALVGGLGILAGLLLPITAGVGGLVTAILLMDDATKQALKQSIKPFVDQMKVLGTVLSKHAFATLQQDAKDLGKAFKDPVFKNFASEIGFGLNRVRENFVNAFQSEKFKNFFKELGDNFERQLVDMSNIVIKFGSGFGDVFLAMQPAIDRFLDRLLKVGDEFVRFTSSAGGQAALSGFFLRAEAALASIGNLAVSVGRAFAVMFNLGGASAGISLIDSLRGKIEQFVKFMRANPQSVANFFASAVQIGRDFGNVVGALIKLFADLNTEANRNIAHLILQSIAGAIRLIGGALKLLDLTPLGLIIDFVFGFDQAMQRAAGHLATLFGAVANGLASLPKFLGGGHFDPFIAKIRETVTSLERLHNTPIDPPIKLDGINGAISVFNEATETISLTDEELQALHKQFGIPLKPNVDVSPLETARSKIQEVVSSAFNLNQALLALPGGFGAIKTFADIARNLQGLFSGQNVSVLLKPTVDPASLGTINSQIATSVAAAPAKVKPTLDPGAASSIKTSLQGLGTGVDLKITAGGNAQGVIARTKTALDGLIKGAKAINISAGGNAQAVIGRTQTALNTLMKTKTALNISAGGNAQAVIKRTAAAADALNGKVVKITIKVTKTGSGASLVARGGVLAMANGGITGMGAVQSMAAGGFANFRQFIRPDVIAGESGREAVVPLDRPLGQVDPAVRLLSAFAQGLLPLGGTTINQNVSVVSNSKDPVAVARQVMAHMTAAAY